jgi:hypothetical protein
MQHLQIETFGMQIPHTTINCGHATYKSKQTDDKYKHQNALLPFKFEFKTHKHAIHVANLFGVCMNWLVICENCASSNGLIGKQNHHLCWGA